MLLTDTGRIGRDWEELVELWWALEGLFGFAMSTKSHPTTNRPKAVGMWVKNARKGIPNIGMAEQMEVQWWAWWRGINPGWWLSDGDMVQNGDGSFNTLKCPGQNEFLSIIVCLMWWHSSMDVPSAAWNRAIADVKWVLGKMVAR
ncbi:hypothetical protein K438DRAFT_1634903 [Mycena galopus ATCC 62051]|nr:hypothetical protein K438DRAFT_1634903 [Mycena galopus ATCC 62051]